MEKQKVKGPQVEETDKYLELNGMQENELTEQDWENIRFNVGWSLTH